ncbi:MAG: efflux RND transporter periplasmic adaptor subunit [bacterium]
MKIKNILIFLAAFIFGSLITFLIIRITGNKSAGVAAQNNSKSNMKMAKGGVMVNSAQRQLYGITVGKVRLVNIKRKIRTIGEVTYSVPLLKNITLKYGGYVKHLFVNKPGMSVYKGEPLFTVYSPGLVDSENNFLLAYKNYEKLKGSNFDFGKKEAKGFLDSSIYRLKLWGITAHQINELKNGKLIKIDSTVYSPINGILLKENILQGDYFKAGKPLFKLAGLNPVWMNIWVYEKDVSFVRKGDTVETRFNAYPGKVFSGKISFIYPYLSNAKRVIKVRLVFNNPKGELKPGMYGNADIFLKGGKSLAVPIASVLITGDKPLVFVYKGKGYFAPRYITVGRRANGYYPVLSGLKNGERIVTSGTFLMSADSNLSQTTGSMAGMPGM